MSPLELFQFCPRCGRKTADRSNPQPFRCSGCDLHYYFNPVPAVVALLRNPADEVLFIRRAVEPAKGKLAVPGGFVDLGETAENALRREIVEEVGLEVEALEYLCSALNQYNYRGIIYPVLDFIYLARTNTPELTRALDGVDGFFWLDPARVDPAEIAFPSIRAALQTYLERREGAG